MRVRLSNLQHVRNPSSRMVLTLLFSVVFCLCKTGQSQTAPEAGKPFVSNYLPKEYGALPQNWDIVQDERGVMYFGNGKGVLEYDAVSWRLIPSHNNTSVTTMEMDADGRIYMGEFGEFGYLGPDSLGRMSYYSLLEKIKLESADIELAAVRQMQVTSGGVYFQSGNQLFRWAENRMRVWGFDQPFGIAVVNDKLYFRSVEGKGLMEMKGDSLQLVPGGEFFADIAISAMMPFDQTGESGRILIGTRGHGFFIYDGKSVVPFKTEADEFLKENLLQNGIALRNNTFSLGTVRGGIAIIDRNGRWLQHVDEVAGLQDNTILNQYEAKDGSLWLALDTGIARLQVGSPLSVFDAGSGVNSYTVYVLRHKGTLYVATGFGILYLHTHAGNERGSAIRPPEFRPVSGILDRTWWLVEVEGMLLAGATDGLFQITGDRATAIKASERGSYNIFALLRSRRNERRVFVGLTNGLASVRRDGNTWIDEGRVPGIDSQIRSLEEGETGDLWLGTDAEGVIRVKFAPDPRNPNELGKPSIERFGTEKGLPKGSILIYRTSRHIIFGSNFGIFRFDEVADKFIPDSTFGSSFVDGSRDVEVLAEDHQGNVWFGSEEAAEVNAALRQQDGSFNIESTPFKPIPKAAIYWIYPEKDGVVWFAGDEGLIRYDSNMKKDYTEAYDALIRSVAVGKDSLIYGGAPATGLRVIPKLAHSNNTLRFEFAALSYENESENRYQTMLEGFDTEWSAWKKETWKEFSNLPGGKYTFRVRAKNIYDNISSEAYFSFKILSPWYGTWWAYFLYVLLASGGIFAVVRVRTQKLHARGRELEAIVEKRTLEIRQQASELETLDSIVQVINREVELKNVLNALLEQGLKLFPQAEKGAFLIRDQARSQFTYHAAAGYDIDLFKGIVLKEEEVVERFSEGTSQLEEGVYIVRNLDERPVAEKFKDIPAPKSILAMTVSLQNQLGGVMFFDNLSAANAFDNSDVQKLKRFRQHAVSAISKANTLQELQHSSRELQEQKDKIQQSYENVDLLSKIGKDITATLSIEGIIDTVYENVNTLMDASVFGIGIYNENYRRLEFPATKEKGETLPVYYYEIDDENRPASWCFRNQKEIFSNDWIEEHHRYVKKKVAPPAGERVESMIYLPLLSQNRAIGIITAQSFKKHAYTDYHLDLLKNMATYTTIALDNADAYRKLNLTLDDLRATQQQLVTQEKLASLGALTAGIAHEIKNPLNFVNNFADLSVELVEELREDLEKLKQKLDESEFENLEEILANLEQNAKKINEHGRRADSIVHSMLQHSRGKAGELQETDINAMLEEDLNLAYHGMRAQDSSFNATMETDLDESIEKLNIVPQNVSRVFLNIITNGFYEVHRKKRENGDAFVPKISVHSKNLDKKIEIRIRDNGDGIPERIRDKLFNPFFTTKPTGQGTGLGLSLSYDIIAKEHHGDITFESKEGEYTEFIITLPRNGK